MRQEEGGCALQGIGEMDMPFEDIKGSLGNWVRTESIQKQIKNRFRIFLERYKDEAGNEVYKQRIRDMCIGMHSHADEPSDEHCFLYFCLVETIGISNKQDSDQALHVEPERSSVCPWFHGFKATSCPAAVTTAVC